MTVKRINARRRLLLIIYGALSVTLIVLALFARAYPYFAWDLQWEMAWQAKTWPGLAAMMEALTWLGDDWHPFVIVAVVAGTLILCGVKKGGLAVIISAIGGELFGLIIKLLVGRSRPSVAGIHIVRQRHTLSFPSGHVTHFMVFYGFLFMLAFLHMRRGTLRTSLLFVLGFLLIGIGFSRVYVGEHWPSDVIGGYLVGLCWLGLFVPLYQRWAKATPSQDKEVANAA